MHRRTGITRVARPITDLLKPAGRAAVAAVVLALAGAADAPADILITEVIPNVSTTAERGDVVELFNTGPGAVDLTDWVLTDLDNDPVAGVPQDATFAPGGLAVAPLAEGEFAVIHFVDVAGTASWQVTNYGLRIVAPLDAGSFLGSECDELLLLDASNTPIDFVAWSDTGVAVSTDSWEDLSAVTGVTFDYGLTPGDAAWGGVETVGLDADYYASSVDLSGLSAVSTWGGGSIRRLSTNGVFDVGDPDGPAQWEVVARHEATLGNASDDVPTGGGLQPIRVTDDLATWLGQVESSTFPDRRIAPVADQGDFKTAMPGDLVSWAALLPDAMAGDWDGVFAAADALGFEVVEFLDTASGSTFHILRERFVPGDASFTGMGLFVFYDGAGVRETLALEIPHPIFDDETLEQGALAIPQVLPRVAMFAGTHRNNSTDDSSCDGTFSGGDPYRESDVAHHPDNFFHRTHVWLFENVADLLAVQLHGFCCPGVEPYDNLTDDCVVANGFEAATSAGDFVQVFRERIDAQTHMAGGVDLTTAAVFGDDTDVLGATHNIQGRVSNGVAIGSECNTEALSASGGFAHLEQDPDVRDDPQHIITALIEALDQTSMATECPATPTMSCRAAGIGKSSLSIRDKDGTGRDKLSWRWQKGEATDLADFADPVSGAAGYNVCVYDSSADPQPLADLYAAPGGTCSGKPCWKAKGGKGYDFKDKLGGVDGLLGLKLGAGPQGKSKVIAKAGRLAFDPPLPPFTLPVTIQFVVTDGMTVECWESTFTSQPKDNEAGKFKARD